MIRLHNDQNVLAVDGHEWVDSIANGWSHKMSSGLTLIGHLGGGFRWKICQNRESDLASMKLLEFVL